MLLLLKASLYLCTDNVTAAGQSNIFNDIVTTHMKRFLAPNKRKSARRKYRMYLYYLVVEAIIILENKQQLQQAILLPVSYYTIFSKK